MQHYKGGVRIWILCGYRALVDYRQRCNVIAEASNQLSANLATIPMSIEQIKSNIQGLREVVTRLRTEITMQKLHTLTEDCLNSFVVCMNLVTHI